MQKLVIANWKMNPVSLPEANRLLAGITSRPIPEKVKVIVCPPTPYISALKILRRAELGAQDSSWEKSGPFTGATSPVMLKNLGVNYVILGHSERRIHFKETDQMIERKIRAVIESGLKAILCVGETAAIHKRGQLAAEYYVKNQIVQATSSLKKKEIEENIIVAYEPIWAISTNLNAKPDDPQDAARMISFIKKITKGQVIYGGSVNGKNAHDFLKQIVIDGVLVGNASLKAAEFKKIITAASEI